MQATLDAATALDTGDTERLAEVVSRWEPARPLRADEVEFERFFREHHRGVYVFALHLVGDPAQAEDVASEVLVKVYLKWRGGRVSSPKAYLRRAVVNHTHSWLRRKQVERRYLERQPPETGVVDPSVGRVDDAQVLTRALSQLPPRQRAAIVLRYYEDLSEAETAEVLGCSVGTVKSQVHRGIAKLREVVGSEVLAGGER